MKISVRTGTAGDVSFVRDLAIRSVHFGIPSTRDIDPEIVREMTGKILNDLYETVSRDYFRLLIATDEDTGKKAGYLMLFLNDVEGSTGQLQAMIHDLAVEPEYWGSFAVDRLMEAAEETAREMGLEYIVGGITADNRRPLVYAVKRLKYRVERYQIVKRIGKKTTLKIPDRDNQSNS